MEIEVIEDIGTVIPKYMLYKDGTVHLDGLGKTEVVGEKILSSGQETFLEGSEEIYKEKTNQKRNAKLRAEAIKRYKLNCYVCSCNFEEMYGEYGAGYIELHHLKLLADSNGERKSTVDDVRVVCSNCHSVLHHQGRTPMDIDELKAYVQARRSKVV